MTNKHVETKETFLRREIVRVCRSLHNRNMLAAADGNVSCRLDEEKILITPSGRPKGFIEEDEMALISLQGEVLSGNPSGERLMHLEVYRSCPEAQAVVHAHPPTCIAWSIAQPEMTELPCEALSEVILATGGIPIVPYARPTTISMGSVLREYLPSFRVMILSRHGGLSWGESLEEAYMGMERMEHSAHILYLAHNLGQITHLPPDEIRALRVMREKIGTRTL